VSEDASNIWEHGQFLLSIEYYGFRVNLYSVGKEYYEVFYNPDTNEIEKIDRTSAIELEKFLNRIDLSTLQ
jgi:hypothetical protein